MTGEEFKAARLAAGLSTQRLAAEILQSDLRTVQRWESGARPIPGPVRTVLRLLPLVGEEEVRASLRGDTASPW